VSQSGETATETAEPAIAGRCLTLARALAEEGAVVFAKASELGLEGKRAGSLYKSGPSRAWFKTKNPDFVRT
jgi:ATP-dependent DNA ligase